MSVDVYTPEDFASDAPVKVLVNGEYYGDAEVGETAGQIINSTALDSGFKKFTVLLDGAAFDVNRKNEELPGGSVLELIAKDDRA
jgi:hypothetical protein